jgi:hypothetical protein
VDSITLELVSLLATCHSEKQAEGGFVSLFCFLHSFFNLKYLESCSFKLRIVFIFEILVSRSSKLDPIFIGVVKLFFWLYILNYYHCTFNLGLGGVVLSIGKYTACIQKYNRD